MFEPVNFSLPQVSHVSLKVWDLLLLKRTVIWQSARSISNNEELEQQKNSGR